MKFGDKGQAVETLQKRLIKRGYQLPTFGADGHLGDETWDALQDFALAAGLTWRPLVHPHVVEAAHAPFVRSTLMPAPSASTALDVRLIDLRGEQDNPPVIMRNGKRANKHRLDRSGRVFVRVPSTVTGITIHQTAAKFGVRRHDRARWPSDPHRALAERAKEVACHAMAFHDGFLVLPNPVLWWVYHGNALNRFELGLEIDGDFPGLEKHRKPHHTKITDVLVRAARAGVRKLVEEGRREGCPIEFIHAHRQSSPSRVGDPGEALWKLVVLQYAVPVLGLRVELDRTWVSTSKKAPGTGSAIPREWDPKATARYR